MKYKFRGQLNDGTMVDIFDFENDFAKCDHKKGNIHIDEFNSIIIPRDTFKKEFLKKEIEEVKFEKMVSKKSK